MDMKRRGQDFGFAGGEQAAGGVPAVPGVPAGAGGPPTFPTQMPIGRPYGGYYGEKRARPDSGAGGHHHPAWDGMYRAAAGGGRMAPSGASMGGGHGGMAQSPPAPNQHKLEIRVLFNARFAGAVIGRGGDNIKRLRTTYEVHVNVPSSETPERVLHISTQQEDWKRLHDALVDLIPHMCEEKESKVSKDDKEYEVRVLIHQSHAGAIIGKGGCKIRDIRENTQAMIKVFATCAPASTERIVMIQGSLDMIMDALKRMRDTIGDTEITGAYKPYDANNYHPELAKDYGGIMVAGASGMGARMGGMPGGGPMGGPYGAGGPRGHHQPGVGAGPPMIDYGQGMPGGPMAQQRGFGGAAMPHFAADPYSAGAPLAPMQAPGAAQGPVTVQQVTIPDSLAGTVIGRGGDRIAEIRKNSQAKVVVEAKRPGEQERIITITGTQAQIHSAQYMLQQCVRSSEAGRRYIDGQSAAPRY